MISSTCAMLLHKQGLVGRQHRPQWEPLSRRLSNSLRTCTFSLLVLVVWDLILLNIRYLHPACDVRCSFCTFIASCMYLQFITVSEKFLFNTSHFSFEQLIVSLFIIIYFAINGMCANNIFCWLQGLISYWDVIQVLWWERAL